MVSLVGTDGSEIAGSSEITGGSEMSGGSETVTLAVGLIGFGASNWVAGSLTVGSGRS